MAIPSSIVAPVIGAFISGLIGVITVEYRNYRGEVAEVHQWYDQAIRLASQLERETPDSYLDDIRGNGPAKENAETADDVVAAYGIIGERLREHVNRAPRSIDETVISAGTETARSCRIVTREGRTSGFLEQMEPAVGGAQTLREQAKEARESVGLI